MTEVTVKAPTISPEEYKKYRGKNVAIYNNRIIASGENSSEALQKSTAKTPQTKTPRNRNRLHPNRGQFNFLKRYIFQFVPETKNFG